MHLGYRVPEAETLKQAAASRHKFVHSARRRERLSAARGRTPSPNSQRLSLTGSESAC